MTISSNNKCCNCFEERHALDASYTGKVSVKSPRDVKRFMCGSCVAHGYITDIWPLSPEKVERPKRKRVPAYMKMTQHRIYGKHTLERRYCRKCRQRYFVIDGKLDCECPKPTSREKRFDLKAWRKEHGVTQGAVAKLLGVSQVFISRIERGEKELPKHHFKKLMRLTREGKI